MSGLELAIIWCGWVLAGASPGPATLGIASTAMAEGRGQALAFSAGILTGGAFWGLTAALGMGALMLAHVWVFLTIKYVGAAYLLYLACKSLRSAFSEKAFKKGEVASGSLIAAYRKGTLIHLTNPKAILSWGAVFSIVLPPSAPLAHVLGMFAFLYSGGVVVFIGYAFLFSMPTIARRYRASRRWFELAFAGLFGAAGLKVLTVRVE